LKKLAIITTHPIQYYAPVFKLLSERQKINSCVFYTLGAENEFDKGFNKGIVWDIPLLDGYDYEWVKNTAAQPGSHHYKGIINPTLINQIEAYNPDALLIFGWSYQSHLKVIRHFKNKIPVYFRGDSNLLDKQSGIKSLLRFVLLKWVYRHISHAFYTGTNNKAYFKKYGLNESRLTFAPHAIDNNRFAAKREHEVKALRDNLNITDDDILILFAGKFEEKKAPGLLLQAFLNIQLLNVHLLFVGNGVLQAHLQDTAKMNPHIHFIDFQNQSYMPVVYQACDLLCLPSKGPAETWGLAVNEAMACGKAILVSDKCGCATDLVTPLNGIIFKSGDIEDLTLNLKKLVLSKNNLTALGYQSRQIIQQWNFTAIAEAIEGELLNEV
jgi:glycosyltransferase involved in cell wall biosynthesis